MEAIKLQHLNIHATVSAPFSLSWSEDDKIAVTTVEGINILVFDPDPENDKFKFTFKRSNISPSTTDPSEHIKIYADDLACSVDRIDAYNLILDAPIAPTLNGLAAIPAQPTAAAWSCAGALANARCALAAVDSLGQVALLAHEVAGGHRATDLTALWATRCRPTWSSTGDRADMRLRQLVARSAQLRTTAVAWAPREPGSGTTTLVCSQRDGTVVWFSVTRCGGASVEASAVPALGVASALAALPDRRVALAGVDGRVSLVDDTGAIRSLWPDADALAASWMIHLPDVPALLAAKGNFLVAMGLNDSSTAVHGIDSLFIGGATPMSGQQVCLVTQAGALLVATVSLGDGGRVALALEPVRWPNAAPGVCGLAHSRNSVIWAVLGSHVDSNDCTPTQLTFFHVPALAVDPVTAALTAPSVWRAQDHLELLRSQLMHRRMEGAAPLPHLSLPTARPLRWDGLAPAQLRVWRWITLAQAAHEKRLAKKDERPLTAFPHNKQHPLYKEVLHIEHLLGLDNCCRRIAALTAKGAELTSDERLSLALMRRYLTAVLASSDQRQPPSTGPPDRDPGVPDRDLAVPDRDLGVPDRDLGVPDRDLGVLDRDPGLPERDPGLPDRDLDMPDRGLDIGAGPTLDCIRCALALAVPAHLPATEPCALCAADSRVVSVGVARCVRGHTLPRCALSLRQLLHVPYLLCARCDLVALPDVEPEPHCLFCDAPFELLNA